MVVIGNRRRASFGLCLGALTLASATAAYGGMPTEESNAQDELWSRFKNVKAGPLTFDFSGQARLRYEYDDGFSVKGYAPGTHDQLLLTRLRPELAITFCDQPKLFLQLQDAHVLLTRLGEADFPQSNPLQGSPLDIRQLYLEWLNIGGSRRCRQRPGAGRGLWRPHVPQARCDARPHPSGIHRLRNWSRSSTPRSDRATASTDRRGPVHTRRCPSVE
jgi:hypothetical protein